LGTPFPVGGTELSLSSGLGNYAASWLNPQFAGFGEGTNSIGFLKIKLPEGVTADDSYSVSFERVSGSPNGISVFESRTRSGILSLSDRSESSFGDGIPDIWRLRNFGSAFNVLSHADADADGDGVPNWKEFKAGTHPNDVTSLLAVKTRAEQGILKLSWPTVDAKKYVLECSDSLFGDWIQVGPVIEGNGDPMEILPEGSLENRFYRVRLIE